MIIELVKRLNAIDKELSLECKYGENIYQLSVNYGILGSIYSFASPDLLEVITRANHYIECLKDSDKFGSLVEEIKEKPLEA